MSLEEAESIVMAAIVGANYPHWKLLEAQAVLAEAEGRAELPEPTKGGE